VEAITTIDALRRANADVVVASAEDGAEIVGLYGLRIVADVLLDAAADQQFDLIVVPASRRLLLPLDVLPICNLLCTIP
jgi:4-methyl-5(b-hydroxyethyl)-thiazole monophosphate biosynthesis